MSLTDPIPHELELSLARMGALFMNQSPLQRAARNIAARLDALGVEYAIAGALSVAAHGLVRATEDVNVLLSHEGLARFKAEWLGRGYVNLREGGKAIRDTSEGAKIDFLIEGDFPATESRSRCAFRSPVTRASAQGPSVSSRSPSCSS